MKRKGLLFVTLLLLLCVLSMCFVACNEPPHEHDYKMQTSDTMHWLKCDCGDTKDYNVHSGGTATCVSKAKCTTCNEEYGELGDHIYGEWKTNYNSTHSKVCINEASHVITENCSGGTATEEERAICDICNSEYGVPLKHTHNFNKQEVKDAYLLSEATCEEKAEYYYSCKCGEKGNTTFGIGEPLGHAYGDWISNGDDTHTKTCANDNNHKITENCNGGTATCTTKAICEDCNALYGYEPLEDHDYQVKEDRPHLDPEAYGTVVMECTKCKDTYEQKYFGHSIKGCDLAPLFGQKPANIEDCAYCHDLSNHTCPCGTVCDVNVFYRYASGNRIAIYGSYYYLNASGGKVNYFPVTSNASPDKMGPKVELATIFDGKIVAEVDASAFNLAYFRHTLYFPGLVESIGNYVAAYNNVMTGAWLPKTVKSIGANAFYSNERMGTILYEGTCLEFQRIEKGSGWLGAENNSALPGYYAGGEGCRLIASDGDVLLN